MIEIIITENQLEFLVKSSNDKTDGILNEIKIPKELISIITKLGLNDVTLLSSIKKNMDVTPDQFKKLLKINDKELRDVLISSLLEDETIKRLLTVLSKAEKSGNQKDVVMTKNLLKKYMDDETIDALRQTFTKSEKEGILQPLVRKAVVRSTTPIGYDPLKLINVPSEILLPKMAPKTWSTKNRYDAWYLYNGMNPKYNTFTKIGDNTYRINDFLIPKSNLDAIVKYPKNKFSSVEIEKEMNFGAIHGNGGIEKGSDKFGNYIEFFDEWDLQPLKAFKKLPEKIRNFEVSSITGGKPFWTRNKIYYDEKGNYYNWDRSPLYLNTQRIKNEGFDGIVDYIATKNLKNVSAQESLDDWNKIASYSMSKTAFTVLVPLAAFIAIQQSKLKDKEKKVYFNMVAFGKKKNMTLKEVKEYCDTKANEQECEVIYQGI
jgi:hypothetical protein